MMSMFLSAVFVFAALTKSASASVASTFTAPAAAPTDTSSFYVGASNGTIQNSPLVPGAVFDRIVQIWLENTDYDQAATQSVFQNLSSQGITLTGYYALTHPSEPNYIASVAGDFWGLGSDDLVNVPSNISTVVDLLDLQGISWAEYQENMPTDGYTGYTFTNPNNYTYYARKHNPLIIYDSVNSNSTRTNRIRNFNDFAVDLGNNTIPQWVFVTPNLRNDGHDTTVGFAAQWLQWWLEPLLQDPNFNTPRTLIVLTFDETETYTINNQVYTILLGGAIPDNLINTTDDTFYTHYSLLSTVEANWNLDNLGRGDTNKTLANVFSFVADVTGYNNNGLNGTSNLPLLNITGTIPGPLNPDYYIPYLAPNTSGIGGGNGSTFVANGVNQALNQSDPPAAVNLTASNSTSSGTSGAVDSFVPANLFMSAIGVVFVSGLLL